MPEIINLDVNIFLSVIGAVMVALLGLLGYLIRLKVGDLDKKRDKETCDKIHQPVDKAMAGISLRIGDLDKKRNKETCDKIHQPIDKAISEIREFLLAKRFSPRDFSEHAEAIFIQSRIQEFIDSKLSLLCGEIDQMRPGNIYDAEVMAERAMQQFRDEEAVKNGAERADISLETMLFVSAIYLGKKYIEKHPELPEK